MKPLLLSVISESQSTFIPSRLITDNILVAFELNHFMKCKFGGSKVYVALKLDMSKTYDKVECEYLKRVLFRLRFHFSFVNLVMMYVTIVSYSLMLNGEQFGFFRLQRGIHQGRSSITVSFFFCTEVLSCLLCQAKLQGKIKGWLDMLPRYHTYSL